MSEEQGFFHESIGYWQTNGEPTEEVLAGYPEGTIPYPLKPGFDYEPFEGGWRYVEPEPHPEVFPDLQKWRVDSAIDLKPGLRDKINAAIELMTEPQRTVSRNKLASVQMFEREDPLFSTLGAAVGMTEAEIDEMWRQAAAL